MKPGRARRPARLAALVVTLPLAIACGPRAAARLGAESPDVLASPAALGPDFMVEQRVEVARGGVTGGFDAVVQKQGDELLVVGLGPMKTRAFVIRQKGADVTFEQLQGPPLPFSPRNVVVDVHRIFFKRLASVPPGGEGSVEGEVDGERVVEVWRGGALRERRFLRPGERRASVRVAFGDGCLVEACRPDRVTVDDDRLRYRLEIVASSYTTL